MSVPHEDVVCISAVHVSRGKKMWCLNQFISFEWNYPVTIILIFIYCSINSTLHTKSCLLKDLFCWGLLWGYWIGVWMAAENGGGRNPLGLSAVMLWLLHLTGQWPHNSVLPTLKLKPTFRRFPLLTFTHQSWVAHEIPLLHLEQCVFSLWSF